MREIDLQQTEALLREMLAQAEEAEERARPRKRLLSKLPNPLSGLGRKRASAGKAQREVGRSDALAELFAPPDITPEPRQHLPNLSSRRRKTARTDVIRDRPQQSSEPTPRMKKDTRRTEFLMAACGVALGLTCALFPWYIFFNPDQFGVQAMKFGGRGHNAGRIMVQPDGAGTADPLPAQFAALNANLDLGFTGSLQTKSLTPEQAPGADEQPYPLEAVTFRLVHVANGRAMIEDNAGLWIVQPGSTLPDSSRVKSIEQRKGKWVLVTSTDRVIEVSK